MVGEFLFAQRERSVFVYDDVDMYVWIIGRIIFCSIWQNAALLPDFQSCCRILPRFTRPPECFASVGQIHQTFDSPGERSSKITTYEKLKFETCLSRLALHLLSLVPADGSVRRHSKFPQVDERCKVSVFHGTEVSG